VEELLRHVTLVAAILALGDAALRAASPLSPAGLERALVAVVIAVAAAVSEALLLGLVGLGGSPVALALATAAVWVAAVALLPRPATSPAGELVQAWSGLSRAWQLAAAVLGGLALAWVAWQLSHPAIGFDSSLYHYPEISAWIQNGRPGSVIPLSYDIPYGYYPLTDEVAQTWAAGIARSWVPLALWQPAMLLVLVGASWQTLRVVGVPRGTAGLATAALAATPLLIRQLNEPQTDLPAMAWLACTAALSLGARRRPALLMPALLAAGLAAGTKTTVAPGAVAALCVGAFGVRRQLRPLAGRLGLAAAAAVGVGGVWYLRNLVEHGWPLWPFMEAPWGDPRPALLAMVDTSFLQRPIATLDGRLGEYTARLGGGWVVLVCAPLAVVAAAAFRRIPRDRARPVLVSGAVTLLLFLIWASAWGTGLQANSQLPGPAGWPLSALRYLLPAIGAGVLTVALATRTRPPLGPAAKAVLALALGWSLVEDARLGAPYTPPLGTLALGVGAGAAAFGLALAAGRALRGRTWPRLPAAATAAVAVLAAGAVLAAFADGFVDRYTRVSNSTAPGAEVVTRLLDEPGLADDAPIAFASRAVIGPLAGDEFRHRLELIPRTAGCAEVGRFASRAAVVVTDPAWFEGILGTLPYRSARCLAARRPSFQRGAYSVYLPSDAAAAAR
jgi:hypothetical protein